jgi:hypothetical protein
MNNGFLESDAPLTTIHGSATRYFGVALNNIYLLYRLTLILDDFVLS